MSHFPFREERSIDQLYSTDDIYDFVGRGTFASVFKGTSLVDGEKVRKGCLVALKVFLKRELTSEKMRQDVINEVEILRQLNHHNCLQLLDCFHTQFHVVIVTNFVEGKELFKALHETVFTEKQVRSIIRQLLEALNYLHNVVSVVHRDVKPENLLVTPTNDGDYHVTVVDFGLARAFSRRRRVFSGCGVASNGGRWFLQVPPAMSADSLESSYTESPLIATPCGTLNYAAPETVRSLTQSSQLATTAELLPRMDVYAVGAVLYVMLSGKLPFHHSGNKMQLVKVMEAGPLFEESRWRNAPREAIELTRALLNFDPAKRPEAAEALRYEWLCSEEKVGEVSNDSTRNGVSTDGSDCWVTPTPQVASDDELLRRGFDGLRQPEGSLYDTGNGGIAACGWCISVPFGAPRQTVPSYFGFCQ